MAGCFRIGEDSPKAEAGTYVAPVVRSFTDLGENDAVVVVNGTKLTKKYLSDIARLQASIYAKSLGMLPTDPRVMKFQLECEQKGIAEFIIQQLLVEESRRRGLSITSQMEREHTDIFAGLLGVPAGEATYESLAQMAGVSGKTVRNYLEGNQLAQLVQESFVVSPESVPDEEVTNLVSRLATINEDCAESNKLQVCALKDALAAVNAGRPFEEVAKEVSEIKPEDGRSWGAFTKSELALYEHRGRKFTEWAFSSPVGSITPEPVQLDDGVSIVKILGRTDGVEEPSVVAIVDQKTVELARITRRAFDPPEALNAAKAREQMAAERTRSVQIEFNKKLFANSRIEYPNGTNLWDSAASQ